VFDLDETLIHCLNEFEEEVEPCDAKIPIQMQTKIENAYIYIRPYLRECLEEANKHFEVVIFTAAHQRYADPIIDYIDPTNTLIQHRLYRDSCIEVIPKKKYLKDLRIFKNRPLSKIVIVDNAVYSFGSTLSNGIPIAPFFYDKEDIEFLHLIKYLRMLAKNDDVRKCNRKAF
jgi:CTD small phosphatase-like protein 2